MEEARQKSRCLACWHTQSCCICTWIHPLTLRLNVRFLVYLHPAELYNAGDDAKLLKLARPDGCELLVCGRRADDERLIAIAKLGNTILLFPSEGALTVDQLSERGLNAPVLDDFDGEERDRPSNDLPLQLVVVDGTWKVC